MRIALGLLLLLAACSHHAAKPMAARAKPAAAPAPGSTELTPDIVIAKLKGGYATGVQRCYTRYLKNRSGHGRVIVSFTVNAKGEAMDGAASGAPKKLGGCIVAEVARWRFPAPRRGEQSFAVPLDLVVD